MTVTNEPTACIAATRLALTHGWLLLHDGWKRLTFDLSGWPKASPLEGMVRLGGRSHRIAQASGLGEGMYFCEAGKPETATLNLPAMHTVA